MSAFARVLALVVLATSIPVAAVCQLSGLQSPDSARELLAEAITAEKPSESGRLCFQIRIEGESASGVMEKEAKEVDHVEYSWAPGGKFRIALMSKTGAIREIVSDGKVISTGGKIWDARFAWSYNPHGNDDSDLLEESLSASMWVYSVLLNFHLHPLSKFQNVWKMDRFELLYKRISTKGTLTTSKDTTVSTLQLDYYGRRGYREFLQIESSDIAYAKTNQPAGSLSQGLVYERADPIRIEEIGWLPRTCVITAEPTKEMPISPYRWTSKLCSPQPSQPVDSAEFALKYAASDVIPWPYGSRLKNYLYGIVNTLEDWWEGISDGVIGD